MNVIHSVFLTRASDVLGDTDKGLSGSEIVKKLNEYAYDLGVNNIPYGHYPFPKNTPNKRTVLLNNLNVFQPEQQYKIIKELCEYLISSNRESTEVDNLKIQLIARYGAFLGHDINPTLNQTLIEEVKTFLFDYPDSEKLYLEATTKFNNNIFERNLVDDLRLSLELLLKQIFKNEKSLENQIPEIGSFIKNKGGSVHFSNMFRTLVDYYSKYQNAFVKHNDAIIEDEVEFIFEMTSSFMKQLIKMNLK